MTRASWSRHLAKGGNDAKHGYAGSIVVSCVEHVLHARIAQVVEQLHAVYPQLTSFGLTLLILPITYALRLVQRFPSTIVPLYIMENDIVVTQDRESSV